MADNNQPTLYRIDENPKKKKPDKVVRFTLISIPIIFFIGIVIIILTSNRGDQPIPPTSMMLKAKVSFDGSQFFITNQGITDWDFTELTLNSDYRLYAGNIKANTEYSVGSMQFSKNDGTRFNPFLTKPKEMIISCQADGKKGYWGCSWK
jgi:hypothetical protein